jgi:putative ABC transport system permease protein
MKLLSVRKLCLKVMGMTDPTGKIIEIGERPRQIIGVLQDFHFESLHIVVAPMYYALAAERVSLPILLYKFG